MTFQIKVTENKTGGKIYSYDLQVKRGHGHWWGIEVRDTNEMRQIAEILVKKANSIEKSGS